MWQLRRTGMITGRGALDAAGGGGGGYTGPGDVVASAYSWWGLRGYNAAYGTGAAVDLVDQAGANQTTINITSAGDLDVSAVNTWVTANSVTTIKVKKLYDQVSTRHMNMATLSQMPVLNLTGNGSKPSMDFSGSTVFMQATSVTLAQPFSVSSALYLTTAGSARGRYEKSGASPTATTNAAGTAFTMNAGSTLTGGAVSTATWYALQEVWNNASSASYQNGSNTTGTVGTNAFSANTLNFGAGGGNFWVGRYSEFGMWPVAFSTAGGGEADLLNTNQRAYWSF